MVGLDHADAVSLVRDQPGRAALPDHRHARIVLRETLASMKYVVRQPFI
jgi:hypothetical protein